MTFNHVADPAIRSVLEGDTSKTAISVSIDRTADYLIADAKNEDVPADVLRARQDAFDDACVAWNIDGDAVAFLEAFKRVWSV